MREGLEKQQAQASGFPRREERPWPCRKARREMFANGTCKPGSGQIHSAASSQNQLTHSDLEASDRHVPDRLEGEAQQRQQRHDPTPGALSGHRVPPRVWWALGEPAAGILLGARLLGFINPHDSTLSQPVALPLAHLQASQEPPGLQRGAHGATEASVCFLGPGKEERRLSGQAHIEHSENGSIAHRG